MMYRSILLICFALSFGHLSGQTVTIKGKATDYAGKELLFYTFSEPISRQAHILAQTKVAPDGAFTLSFTTPQTIEVYADLGKYRGSLVVEPGEGYQVSLPPFTPRGILEAASPYFEPEFYWLGLKGSKPSDINFLVRSFLTDFNKELALHTLDIYQKRSADTVRAILSRLGKKYPAGKNNYLNTLMTYSFGELECSTGPVEKEHAAEKYFAKKEVFLSHPAYQNLFNLLYSGYLTNKSEDIRDKGFVAKALQGDFEGFVHQLTEKGFNREPAELIAVKCFYEGYYSGKFDKRSMLKGLKAAESSCTFNPLKEAIPGIINKISSLREGSQAPAVMMKDQKNAITLFTAKKKFVYLAFFRSDSKSCVAELDSLVSIEKRLKTILAIVPVSLDANPAEAVRLWAAKKYPWELAEAANPDRIRSDYQIKSLPTFYLVSPDQKLLLAPALAPSHNFEPLFLKIYRESRFRQ